LRAAMASADSLGASTELSSQEGGLLVRNYSCPLGAAVRVDESVCRGLTAFFSEATGKPAQTRCLRDERLLCQYLIELSGTSADHKKKGARENGDPLGSVQSGRVTSKVGTGIG